jgi:hypothetical protein
MSRASQNKSDESDIKTQIACGEMMHDVSEMLEDETDPTILKDLHDISEIMTEHQNDLATNAGAREKLLEKLLQVADDIIGKDLGLHLTVPEL